MRTFSPPAHRAQRRALTAQLAPAALRTRPYAHPLEDPQPDAVADELDVTLAGRRIHEGRR